MNWSEWTGWVAFFLVPGLLWAAIALGAMKLGHGSPIFSIIAGSDNRLSLSRFQAFVWTQVIFGAYAAAWAVGNVAGPDGTWIEIPDSLLQLAGISLASGVFSTLIAQATGEEKSARVLGAAVDASTTPLQLVITGVDFGDRGGVVYLGPRLLSVLEWTDTRIRAEVPPGEKGHLVVDTPNGKVTHEIVGEVPTILLGPARTNYDFVDLFRNDRNPRQLDLMKFQMFGWTCVAVASYVVIFLAKLAPAITKLPTVDETLVLLTGLSQTGYLAGKAATGR